MQRRQSSQEKPVEHTNPGSQRSALPVVPAFHNPSTLDELLTVEEVAALFKVSKGWIYEHTRARGPACGERLPCIKLGKYVRFDPESVRRYLAGRIAGRGGRP
jgi:excisionase family DNA binding protein